MFGKYLNQYPQGAGADHVPPGWDEWYAGATETAYTNYGYRLNENGRTVGYGAAPEDYLTDVLAGHADAFLRRGTADRRPFFMYIAPYVPHAPATPAPRHTDAFPGVQAPRPPSFNEADVSDKPSWVRDLPPLGPAQVRALDATYRRRLQSLLAVEDMLERLDAALAETGALDNTYVFFTSDHGYHIGQHRMPAGKLTPYDEDVRVRLIVRGPGVPAGHTANSLVANLDLAPTFAALAGAAAPEWVDGRSFASQLGAEPAPATWRSAVLLEQGADTADSGEPDDADEPGGGRPAAGRTRPQPPAFRGLRTAGYKYVEYATGERELYDLAADPYELVNRAASADPALVAALSARLDALRGCAGPDCRRLEDEPLPPAPVAVR
ncbi:MAG: sulfatase [Dehalococcoidia bacterium]